MQEKTKHSGLMMVISVIAAIVVWSYVGNVANRDESGVFRNIPVNFVGLEDLENRGLTVISGLDQTVTLNITGKRDAIRLLSADTINITVDVSTTIQQPGQFTQAYQINYELPSTASRSSLVVTDQYPLNITFTVAKVETRTIPIRGTMTGGVAEGYQAGSFSFSPESIEIRGEASVVNSIEYALVTLEQENLAATFHGELPYTLISFVGDVVDTTDLETDYTLIDTTLPIIRLKEVELSVGLLPGGGISSDMIKKYVTCEIVPSTIMVSGAETDLEALQKLSLGNIDLSKVFGDSELTFTIPLASELTNVSGVTEATVKIEIHGLSVGTMETDNIELINAPSGYKGKAVTQSCSIQLRGTEEALEALTAEQLRVVGDLQSATVSTGTQTIPVKVYVDSGGEIGVLGEYSIVVSISRE